MAVIGGSDGNDTLDRRTETSSGDFFYGGLGNDIIYGSVHPSNAANSFYGGRTLLAGTTDNDVMTGGRGINTFYPLFGRDRFVGTDHSREDDFDGFGDILDFTAFGSIEVSSSGAAGAGIRYGAVIKGAEVDLAAGTFSANTYAARDPLPTSPSHVTTGTLVNIFQVSAAKGTPADLMADRFFGSNNRAGTFEVFDPGNGDDLVDGRGGFDFISYSLSSRAGFQLEPVTVDLAKGQATDREGGTDTLRNIEGIIGSPAGDRLLGDEGDNILRPGLPGATTQGDTINGRGGIDIVDYSGFGPVQIALTSGFAEAGGGARDRLSGIENARGGDGQDTLLGNDLANVLFGGAGDDTLRGGGEKDTLRGGDGADALNGGFQQDRLIGGRGEDMIVGGGGEDVLAFDSMGPMGVNVALKTGVVLDPWGDRDTVSEIETVVGTDKKDIINGDDLPNTIKGSKGPDNLGGQGGDDVIYGGDAKDAIGGGEGNDRILGGDGPDTIFGGPGRDTITGGDKADQVFGGGDADTVEGSDGNDEIKDTADETNIFSFVNGARDAFDPVAYAAAIEEANHLQGGVGKDTLLGTGLLEGGADNDVLRGSGILSGGGGNDLLVIDAEFGQGGNDYGNLVGGRGNDTLRGDEGLTIVNYYYAKRGVVVDLEEGTSYAGAGDRDALEGIWGVEGSSFDDRFIGSSAQESFLSGQAGNDVIRLRTAPGQRDAASGGVGEDKIFASGSGRADISGGPDSDTIDVGVKRASVSGGGGEDKITVRGVADFQKEHEIDGNGDNDTFVFAATGFVIAQGGAGDDRFVFRGVDGSFELNGGRGVDTYDFKSGSGYFLIEDPRPGEDRFLIDTVLPPDVNSFAKLRKHAEQDRDGVTIELTVGTLDLQDLQISDLTRDMFDL